MSLNQALAVATIVSLFTPLTIAAIKYRSSKPTRVDNAQIIQGMSFNLAERLEAKAAALEIKVDELTDEVDTLLLRARRAEAEREDAYEVLRDHDLPIPNPRV